MRRYDLHVHTAERSPCARSSAGEMCRAALERGLSGIAFTDHDVWWPEREIGDLRLEFPGLSVLAGAEVALEDGHFLVFLPGRKFHLPFGGNVVDLEREVHAAGGVLIWAHPFRYDRRHPGWIGGVRLDGLEVSSSNMNGETTAWAEALADRRGLRAFRNSDAHDAAVLGRYWNELEASVADEAALVRALAPSRP